MNPLTKVKNLNKMNERELQMGVVGSAASWHDQYKDSAWIFVGGLPFDLTEGDVLCIFSQFGEPVTINLVRDKQTGKSKGYAFVCYADQRSTILAVDNLNGSKVCGRTLRVDHVEAYRKPKDRGDEDEITEQLRTRGLISTEAGDTEPKDSVRGVTLRDDTKSTHRENVRLDADNRTGSKKSVAEAKSTKQNAKHRDVSTESRKVKKHEKRREQDGKTKRRSTSTSPEVDSSSSRKLGHSKRKREHSKQHAPFDNQRHTDKSSQKSSTSNRKPSAEVSVARVERRRSQSVTRAKQRMRRSSRSQSSLVEHSQKRRRDNHSGSRKYQDQRHRRVSHDRNHDHCEPVERRRKREHDHRR